MKRIGQDPKAGAPFGPAKTAGSEARRLDAEFVRAVAELVSAYDLSEIAIEEGDLRLRVTRQAQVVAATAAPVVAHAQPLAAVAVAAASAAAPDPANLLKSPMVGTVYRRSNPDSKAFVEIGSTVKSGERVLLIEAMKTFNDIVAHRAGTVSDILIEDGQPVEYGEPLLVIV